MVSPVPSNVVIECPNCGTRYQLPADTVPKQGRQVACAHCGGTWKAKPIAIPDPDSSDTLFDEAAEDALDAQFQAAADAAAADEDDPHREARERTLAEIRAAIMSGAPAAEEAAPDPVPEAAPEPPTTGMQRLQQKFRRRQANLNKQLPFARLRRSARIVSLAALILLIAGGVVFRTDIVRRYPDLAGAYELVGLGVNVLGLEFRDVTTLVTLRNGNRVMRVDGRIFSVASRRITVPKALVTLLDEHGAPIYEWSVTPEVTELEPGEVVDFTAQLTSPPEGASSVKVAFVDTRARTENL